MVTASPFLISGLNLIFFAAFIALLLKGLQFELSIISASVILPEL
jgi:hypothetical protein